MKTLFQQLKQAFNALEFTNISQLNELTSKLNLHECHGASIVQTGKSKVVSQCVAHTSIPASTAANSLHA